MLSDSFTIIFQGVDQERQNMKLGNTRAREKPLKQREQRKKHHQSPFLLSYAIAPSTLKMLCLCLLLLIME